MKVSLIILAALFTNNVHSTYAVTGDIKLNAGIRGLQTEVPIDQNRTSIHLKGKGIGGAIGIGALIASLLGGGFLVSTLSFSACVDGQDKKVGILQYILTLVGLASGSTLGACPFQSTKCPDGTVTTPQKPTCPAPKPTSAPVPGTVPTPTKAPVPAPTKKPNPAPVPGTEPTPTKKPNPAPVPAPTKAPVPAPTKAPVPAPTKAPAKSPTKAPVKSSTESPSASPSSAPHGDYHGEPTP